MPLVLKWQGYRDLRVLCKLYSKDSRYSEYASHCVKSVQIRIFFFCFVFSCIWTEYGDLRSKSPYSVRIQENTTRKNSVFGHFSHSARFSICQDFVCTSNLNILEFHRVY